MFQILPVNDYEDPDKKSIKIQPRGLLRILSVSGMVGYGWVWLGMVGIGWVWLGMVWFG